MTPARIAELRALADASTPGAWHYMPAFHSVFAPNRTSFVAQLSSDMHRDPSGPLGIDVEGVAATGRFIAAARTAVPELLDALAAAERERDEASDQADMLVNEPRFAAVIDAGRAAEARATAAEAALEVAREALSKIEAHEREGYCGVCWGIACDALEKLPAKRTP